MGTFALIFGLFFIGLGFFIKKYPNQISPYNGMSAQKKKNIDIEAIALLYKKGMIIIGVATIGTYYLFDLLKMPVAAQIGALVPTFAIMPILLIMIQKHDHNRQRKIIKFLPAGILFVIFIGAGIMMITGIQSTKAIVGGDSIEFTGKYGITVPFDQIKKCELLKHIPRIGSKTNGFAVAGICKGHFRLDEFGKCRLFLRFPNPPYLFLELHSGDKILFNSPDSLYTKAVFEKLPR